MITSQEIAIHIRQVLVSAMPDTAIVWQRSAYEKSSEVVIIPHATDGESEFRQAVVVVNIHCPDIFNQPANAYETDHITLMRLRQQVEQALSRHFWMEENIAFRISNINPAIKEQSYNEHFTAVYVTAQIRNY